MDEWMNGLMDHWIDGKPERLRRQSAFIHQSTNPIWIGRGGRVVYCGGLENRFGLTADGGSNPSLSASFYYVRCNVDNHLGRRCRRHLYLAMARRTSAAADRLCPADARRTA